MVEARRRRRHWLVGTSIAAAAALVIAGGYAASARGSGDSSLRVATVTTGPVTSLLSLTGTAQHVSQVTASFPSTGMVTAVTVHVGEHVTAGQVLATIDPTALQAALKTAQATLAQDQATLASDQSSSASSAAPQTPSTVQKSPSTVQQSGSTVQQSGSTVQQSGSTVQQSGSTVQKSRSTVQESGSSGRAGTTSAAAPHVDTAALQAELAGATAASEAADRACGPVLGTSAGTGRTPGSGRTPSSTGSRSAHATSLTGTPTPDSPTTGTHPTSPPTGTITTTAPTTATSGPGGTATDTTSPTTTAPGPTGTPSSSPTQSGPSAAQLQGCVAALLDEQQAQQRTAQTLMGLTSQLTKVVAAVERAATSAATSTATAPSAPQRSTSSTPSNSTASTGQRSSAATPSSAQGPGQGSTDQATRVAGDEVAILQDEAGVEQAQADLTGATLTASISGVVGQVGFSTGQSATSQSGIVIVGAGAVDVTVAVPLADMPLVKAGLRAKVTPAGAATPTDGYVGAVNLLPSTSGSATPSYPATVVVPDPPAGMPTGSTVTVAVEVASVPDALRVPVSAVGGVTAHEGTVTTLSGTVTQAVAVTLGAVGGGWAQVVRGLTAGQQVVLADASQPLPSNNAPGLRGIGGGGGGFVRVTTGRPAS